MIDDIRPYANQRAKIRLTPETIAQFLDLPAGMVPVAVYGESDPAGIMVVVEGPALDPVDPNAESPYLGSVEGQPWLLTGGQMTGAIRLRIDPRDYPDGVVPTLTGLRKIDTAEDGSDVYEVTDGPGDDLTPFLLNDLPTVDQ